MDDSIRYRFATFIHDLIKKIKRHILPIDFLSPGDQFFKSGGNRRLVDLTISEKALCIDFGGYTGSWTSLIADKYNCFIRIYEPVLDFAENLEALYKFNAKITVCAYGISDANKQLMFSLDGAASGSHGDSSLNVLTDFKDATELMKFGVIDAAKINIEGGIRVNP